VAGHGGGDAEPASESDIADDQQRNAERVRDISTLSSSTSDDPEVFQSGENLVILTADSAGAARLASYPRSCAPPNLGHVFDDVDLDGENSDRYLSQWPRVIDRTEQCRSGMVTETFHLDDGTTLSIDPAPVWAGESTLVTLGGEQSVIRELYQTVWSSSRRHDQPAANRVELELNVEVQTCPAGDAGAPSSPH